MNKAMLKIIIVSGVLAVVRLADAHQAIFLVRHAEDVRSKDVVDRPLTEAGQRRGTLRASVLKDRVRQLVCVISEERRCSDDFTA